MNNWAMILSELSEAARREAMTAPELMADLAQLERYVAESYQQRTLVELIQNADDANASSAACIVGEGYILFGNDGRHFTESDFRSICRSGVSRKNVEGGKIGYRGIGFKSTINLANRIHVLSGDLAFTFSRELTRDAFGADRVPAIRMPHLLSMDPAIRPSIEQAVRSLLTRGHKTFFVLESHDVSKAVEEFKLLEGESLLFLRNLRDLFLQTENATRHVILSRTPKSPGIAVDIADAGRRSNWLVCYHSVDAATAVAFPLNPDGHIDSSHAKPEPAHCFLPTGENSGYAFRVNADFSTDPSRTRIEFDDRSRKAITRLAETVVDLLDGLASVEVVPPWLSQMFAVVSTPLGFSRVGIKLREDIHLRSREFGWLPGKPSERIHLRARPTWLNPNDFATIAPQSNDGMRAIVRLDAQCPQLMKFIIDMGVQVMELSDVAAHIDQLSEMGRVEMVQQFVRELRVTGTRSMFSMFEGLPAWLNMNGHWCTVREAKIGILPKYREILLARLSPAEIEWIGANWSLGLNRSGAQSPGGMRTIDVPVSPEPIKTGFTSAPQVMKRWRRSEENLRHVLAIRLGADVRDVSQSNLGYDLEAVYSDGKKDCIEVKQLNRTGGEFALTSNEYAHATSLGERYIVAICMQDDRGFSWTLIRDPTAHLQRIKRCRQWEWVCSDVPVFTERELF